MKNYFLMFVLLWSAGLAASEFDEAFDMSARGFARLANKVTAAIENDSALNLEQKKEKLLYISTGLAEMEKDYQTSPVYWFVRGLNAKNQASFYQLTGDKVQTETALKEKDIFYIKAIELDKNNEPHLSAAAFSAMKHGLPDKLKQAAIAAELKLGGNGENDSYYWYLHWSNVNELQKQERFEEADQALAQMKKELSASGQSDVFEMMVKKIETELDNKKAKPVSHPEQKQAPVRDHTAFTEDGVEDQYYRYLVMIGLIMLVLIVIAVLVELNRRRKK